MNKFQLNFNQNSSIFNQENALENVVCEMASILSRPQCVKERIEKCPLPHLESDAHMCHQASIIKRNLNINSYLPRQDVLEYSFHKIIWILHEIQLNIFSEHFINDEEEILESL